MTKPSELEALRTAYANGLRDGKAAASDPDETAKAWHNFKSSEGVADMFRLMAEDRAAQKAAQPASDPSAEQAWEQYLAEQKWVYKMPGLYPRPAFIAGWNARSGTAPIQPASEPYIRAQLAEIDRMLTQIRDSDDPVGKLSLEARRADLLSEMAAPAQPVSERLASGEVEAMCGRLLKAEQAMEILARANDLIPVGEGLCSEAAAMLRQLAAQPASGPVALPEAVKDALTWIYRPAHESRGLVYISRDKLDVICEYLRTVAAPVQPASEPSLSKRMNEAGFTRRDKGPSHLWAQTHDEDAQPASEPPENVPVGHKTEVVPQDLRRIGNQMAQPK